MSSASLRSLGNTVGRWGCWYQPDRAVSAAFGLLRGTVPSQVVLGVSRNNRDGTGSLQKDAATGKWTQPASESAAHDAHRGEDSEGSAAEDKCSEEAAEDDPVDASENAAASVELTP